MVQAGPGVGRAGACVALPGVELADRTRTPRGVRRDTERPGPTSPGGNPSVHWQLASESLRNWAAESGIDAESLWHEFEDLGGPRITYLVTPPVTETSVPDCDFAVPFGIER